MDDNSEPSSRNQDDRWGSESPNPIPDEYNQWLRLPPIETKKKLESTLRPEAEEFKPGQGQQGQGNPQQYGHYDPFGYMQPQGMPYPGENVAPEYFSQVAVQNGAAEYSNQSRSASADQAQQGRELQYPTHPLPQRPIPTGPRSFSQSGLARHPQNHNNVNRALGSKSLTCWWWYTKGRCKFEEARCAHSHYHTGRVADGPNSKRR